MPERPHVYTRRDLLKMITPGGWLPDAYKNGFNIRAWRAASKISLLKDGLLGGFVYTQLHPEQEPSYTGPELKQLGLELESWQLPNGIRYIDQFPDLNPIASLLQGRTNPQEYIPYLAPHIGFSTQGEEAALIVDTQDDPNNPNRTKAQPPRGGEVVQSWIKKNGQAVLHLSPWVLSFNHLRLPIAVKEISQVVDYWDYCKEYLDFVKSQGVRISAQIVGNPLSQIEVETVLAHNLGGYERQVSGNSQLDQIVDLGSLLQTAIYFANWELEKQQKGEATPQVDLLKDVYIAVHFLKQKGLIALRDNAYLWTEGQRPKIDFPNFFNLTKDFANNFRKTS